MTASIRSAVFNALFFIWVFTVAMLFLPTLFLPRRLSNPAQRLWAGGIVWLLRTIVGIRMEIRGREHLPNGPALVACKHQSAWDTIIFHLLLDDPTMVIKRELFWIPFYGWYALKWRMIGVDRGGQARTLKKMVAEARAEIARGRSLVIFPEGTRSPVGKRLPYQPGVAALYRALAIPVVPVAVNSGLYWPRRGFTKRPGTIILEFLPPIEANLPRKQFMPLLEARIEDASARLLLEQRQTNAR
ncbi:MAG: lysophospholipid acyltransferase family protein [Proteobacteria bacterium]|nr:lysophospholipid acyltransferase family protein [Pseudomonadota bacterium]